MNRRHTANAGESHVCRPVRVGIDRRNNRNRRVGRIHNDSNGIKDVEPSSLFRNITCWIPQAEKWLDIFRFCLGDDFTLVILGEAIDHDTVKAGRLPDSKDRFVQQL